MTTFFKQERPFVVYKKPNECLIKGLFQRDNQLYFCEDYTETGFVFAPFDDKKPAVILPLKVAETMEQKIVAMSDFTTTTFLEPNNSSKDRHIALIEKALEKIEQQQLKKVVVSRKETLILPHFDIINLFKRLIKNYPTTMVYLWYHPITGLWMGATPEYLLKVNGRKFETMALAATQRYNGKKIVSWQAKEITEQQLVTDYIVNKLSAICGQVNQSPVRTVKAGHLLHLQTKIFGNSNVNTLDMALLINAIHPTPAVCGLPKEASKKFILQNESYNRDFYTGFLGELNFDKKQESTLFVNLRCMKIEKNIANIFVGGGITKDSNPQREWEETVAKSKVIKKAL